ncbi:hypothetical protein KJ359_008772 [Pestalotiopsis sp. 9143b]|nr:hypothetical protein KJ359_008772 [Pestalotiopsis sp. 9143b]
MATHTPIPWTVPGGSIPQITFTRSKTSFTSITKTSLSIAAVVVGAVAFTVFVSVVAYLVRFAIMRRRQNSAEKRQRLDGEAMVQYYPGAAASRSSHAMRSLREDEFRIVIRTPPPAEERPRQLWPNPPGGTQRFTFFSGRSTTTATDSATDPATDRGQWSLGTEHGSSGRSHGTRNT